MTTIAPAGRARLRLSADELATFRRLYPDGAAAAVLEALPRLTPRQVKAAAYRYGLTLTDAGRAADRAARARQARAACLRLEATNGGAQWSRRELAALGRLFPVGGAAAVAAEIPHRSLRAIAEKARERGLRAPAGGARPARLAGLPGALAAILAAAEAGETAPELPDLAVAAGLSPAKTSGARVLADLMAAGQVRREIVAGARRLVVVLEAGERATAWRAPRSAPSAPRAAIPARAGRRAEDRRWGARCAAVLGAVVRLAAAGAAGTPLVIASALPAVMGQSVIAAALSRLERAGEIRRERDAQGRGRLVLRDGTATAWHGARQAAPRLAPPSPDEAARLVAEFQARGGAILRLPAGYAAETTAARVAP